jgi:pimeloyl-ACP methyl ester carboxylesterase
MRGSRTALGLTVMLMSLGAPAVASARDLVVTSFDATPIVAHFFAATGLQPGDRQPTVIVGSAYAAPGATDPNDNSADRIGVGTLRDAGFNVLTWDPRGFGGSGGMAEFDAPDFEARDMRALIDAIASAPEALLDGPGDPRVGMAGSSYGGAIQYVTAAIDQRVDAIVPDIAWHSLVTSFAKENAFKAGWLLGVCANGEILGLGDGVIAGLSGPAGVQLGSTDPQLRTLCLEGTCWARCRRRASSGWRAADPARSSDRSAPRRSSRRAPSTRSFRSARRSRTTRSCGPTACP